MLIEQNNYFFITSLDAKTGKILKMQIKSLCF